MSTTVAILTILGAVAALIVTGGGVYALFKGTLLSAQLDRSRAENADYIARLDFIEPRFKEVQTENAYLKELNDPSKRLDVLSSQGQEVRRVLDAQSKTLDEINAKLPGRPPS